MGERKGGPGVLSDPAGLADKARDEAAPALDAAGNDWIDAEAASPGGGEAWSWCGSAGPVFGERLLARVRDKGGDAFSMAYELTRIFAGSGGGEAAGIPALFADLFEMFETGVDPRARAAAGGEDKDEGKKEKKKDKDKKKKHKDEDD
jgi:hypothetical protein